MTRHSFTAAAAAVALASVVACRPGSPIRDLAEMPAPVADGSAEPNLAVSPSGRMFLSWVEPADSGHALRFAVLDGGGWSAPRTIASGRGWFVNWADFPSLLPLTDSQLVAHWLVRSSGAPYAYDVHVARSSDGGATWSTPVIPHADRDRERRYPGGEHGFVSFWRAGGTDAGLVWLDGGAAALAEARRRRGDTAAVSEMTLRAATLGAGGAVQGDVELDGRICDCCQTSAALTAEGPVVVYRDRSPEEIRDIYVTRRVGGAWTRGRPVANDGWEINACPVNGPFVAALDRRVVVAWFTQARGERRVFAAFSDDAGASFGPKIRVDDGAPVGRVAVVLDTAGGALVSWLEETGAAAEVRVRRIGADSAVGPAAVVTRTQAARLAGFPRTALAGDRLVFAWTVPPDSGPTRVRTAAARLR